MYDDPVFFSVCLLSTKRAIISLLKNSDQSRGSPSTMSLKIKTNFSMVQSKSGPYDVQINEPKEKVTPKGKYAHKTS